MEGSALEESPGSVVEKASPFLSTDYCLCAETVCWKYVRSGRRPAGPVLSTARLGSSYFSLCATFLELSVVRFEDGAKACRYSWRVCVIWNILCSRVFPLPHLSSTAQAPYATVPVRKQRCPRSVLVACAPATEELGSSAIFY